MDTPAGFAPVFAGWNVWDVWQSTDPDQGVLGAIWNAGISQEQLLKLWVENQVEDNAPGANVSDPINPDPEHLRGDEIQPIPKPTGLAVAAARESAGLGGALQLGNTGSSAVLSSVRFYNRGAAAVMPWPHDKNFVVDAVYQPSTTNPITNGAAPTTAGGTLVAAGEAATAAAASVVHVLVVGGVVVGGILLVLKFARSRRAA